MQKTILCYGDSNTWGYIPSAVKTIPQRFSRKERWPGILQDLIGDAYYVVEEGLNSRTTNINYHVPPDRNGKTYLSPCLYSHAPIDLVILALGGNDLKVYFNRSAEQIRDGMAELIDIIQTSPYGPGMQSPPKILLISPPKMLPVIETFTDENGVLIFPGALKKAELLTQLYADLAKEKNCQYLNISTSITPSELDGMHFDIKAHQSLARMLEPHCRVALMDPYEF